MKISKKVLKRIIIESMINKNEIDLVNSQKILHQSLKNKERYKNINLINEELDILGDIGSSILKSVGGDIDSIKSYFISGMLESLGVENEKAIGIITNILEQVGIDELFGLMTGTIGCDDITEVIVKGLVEYALEDGIASIVEFVDELDIPVIDGMIQQFAGGEGILDNREEENLVNAITNKVYPVIGNKIEDFVCGLGFLGMGKGRNDDEGAVEASEELVNEILNYSIRTSYEKTSLLAMRKEKLLLKLNE